MASKILENDLLNKGVLGMADKPGLSAKDMQYKFEEIQREIIIPKLNEVIGEVGSMLSPFDNKKTYAVGEYCIYKDELYKCIDAVTIPGTWNDEKWGGTTLSDALKDLQSQVDNAIKESANAVAEEVAARKAEIAIERARIDSIAKLPEGSTTGDAELIDGRVDYKGNTHTNIGEHIRGVSSQLSGENAELKSDLEDYTYLKSYLEVDADFVSENGKLFNLVNRDEATVSKGCYIKQIIPKGIKRVKVSGKSASAKYYFDLGAFYKADDTLISRFGNDDETEFTDYELDVPNGTAYMIINQCDTPSSSYKKASFFTSRVIKDDVSGLKDDVSGLKDDVSGLKDDVSGLKDDVSVPVEIEADEVNNACWNVVDKNTAGSGCHTKTFVDGYNTILVSGKSAFAKYNFPLGAFYKADDTLISRFGDVDNTEFTDLVLSVPDDASYVIVNQNEISVTEYRKIKALIPNNIYENLVKPLENRVSVLESKSSEDTLFDNTEFALFHTWGLIGDSLSVGHTRSADGSVTNGRNIYYSWGQYLARRLGNNCLNFGKSGISAKTWMSDSLCYERLIDSDNLCQGYIIALGANDTSMTLGSIDDVNFEDMSQNADTEYGWYAKVINAVRTISQDVPIFLFTLPHPRNSDVNIQAINEMIRTFANDKEHFGKIFLVDLDADYNDYFKNGKLQSQIGNTGWHLTSLGYLYASYVNQKALSKVISDNYSDFQDVFMLPYGNNTILD